MTVSIPFLQDRSVAATLPCIYTLSQEWRSMSDMQPHHDRAEASRIDGGSVCTCFKLRRAARRVTQLYDRHLQPTGLRITQFGLLARLRVEPLQMPALAERMGLYRTPLTRNLRPLERLGYFTAIPAENKNE